MQNNINHLIDKKGTECLNQSDEHGLEDCLKKGGGYLESDCDEQVGIQPMQGDFRILPCLIIIHRVLELHNHLEGSFNRSLYV